MKQITVSNILNELRHIPTGSKVYEIQVNDIPIYFVLYPLFILFFLALGEEILFRGITFRILEESVGTLLALLLSASLFGALHMTNNSATVASTISVIILGLLCSPFKMQ